MCTFYRLSHSVQYVEDKKKNPAESDSEKTAATSPPWEIKELFQEVKCVLFAALRCLCTAEGALPTSTGTVGAICAGAATANNFPKFFG
jgi:hypothetical protein